MECSDYPEAEPSFRSQSGSIGRTTAGGLEPRALGRAHRHGSRRERGAVPHRAVHGAPSEALRQALETLAKLAFWIAWTADPDLYPDSAGQRPLPARCRRRVFARPPISSTPPRNRSRLQHETGFDIRPSCARRSAMIRASGAGRPGGSWHALDQCLIDPSRACRDMDIAHNRRLHCGPIRRIDTCETVVRARIDEKTKQEAADRARRDRPHRVRCLPPDDGAHRDRETPAVRAPGAECGDRRGAWRPRGGATWSRSAMSTA